LTRQLQLRKILSHVVLLSPQSYTQAHTDLQVGQSNFSLHSHTPVMAGEAIGVNTRILGVSGGIFILLWSPEIDSEESIPPAYVAWYENPIPTWFLAPIDCFKIPAQVTISGWESKKI
jgi:hypothetical protein